MASDASAGASFSSGAYSPADSKAASGFKSYAEYEAKLKQPPRRNCCPERDILWLASFDGDGHCLKWDYCDTLEKDSIEYSYTLGYDSTKYCNAHEKDSLHIPRNLPAVDGSGVRPYTAILSCHDFRMALQTPNNNVAYRVVIISAKYRPTSSQTKDILGLGLDLGPEIFDYAEMCMGDPCNRRERPWYKTFPALRIGRNVLCILEDAPGTASKTAILFLANTRNWQGFATEYSTSFVMYPLKRPSSAPEGFGTAADLPDYEHENTWLVQRFITSGIGSNDSFGKGNFLYVCLAALIELQLSTAPLHVPHISRDGLQPQVELEYYRQYRDYRHVNLPILPLRYELASPIPTWTYLRIDIDARRTTLRWITRFFRKHFNYSNEGIQAAFEDAMECLTFQLQDLEQSESQVRDHLAVEGTKKSTHMAEMSIRESKRVMLLTALAFIFIPISLASSVYGMNVQQINSTGHSITAFVITAVAMCACSVTLWAASATFQSYRARMLHRIELCPPELMNRWHEELVMNGPLGLMRREFRKRGWFGYPQYMVMKRPI